MAAADPARTLHTLAEQLRAEDTVISPHVSEPADEPGLGLLVAAGPAAAADPASYALVVEEVREGYLLHYGTPRVISGADEDLSLLAGDYLYARGLERLAALGDLVAIRELADLISLSAQLHAEERPEECKPLWLATATAIATRAEGALDGARAALRQGEPGAGDSLASVSSRLAAEHALTEQLAAAAEAIDLPPPERSDLG